MKINDILLSLINLNTVVFLACQIFVVNNVFRFSPKFEIQWLLQIKPPKNSLKNSNKAQFLDKAYKKYPY